ncbi:hydrolase [Allocoprobacillus halotolerans]|uniref:Hydrolase n=1 Tax=Allocoprobacillus halotolerans TaxID=2944914 RepID=A0ABY5HZN4_9FIRM|nr:hydrolase [Allocoprobacillus halotolerans]UTY38185.1 hydrolase [Allocoprobacillus halotolerans]
MEKVTPRVDSKLRHIVEVPKCIYDVSGITINGKRVKSLVFSTDVAIIANCNADAVIAVYPFTPTMQITNAIIEVAQKPVFAGVGGGTTAGPRVHKIALDAELHGATAVVLNAPTKTKFVQDLASIIDIPIVLTVVSTDEPLEERMLHSGASIINVSGGKKTVEIIKALREIDKDFPIIATGGPNEETIQEVIKAGANAVTYTPPTNGEIFKEMMERYRIQCSHHEE